VWALECGGAPEDLGVPIHAPDGYTAPFASGSAGWHAMAIVPCSMGAAGRIAHGTSDSLLTRTADVMLKERRTLVVVPRETPMSTIHLENLLALARAGALVLPACPSFYGKPSSRARSPRRRALARAPLGRQGGAMTSKLVSELVERAGLSPLLAERERGVVPSGPEVDAIVERSDILALGAAADVARRRECGDETRVHVPAAPAATSEVSVIGSTASAAGTALLRHVARERLTGPIGRRIVVDFGAVGLEIAQIALSFGASDLAGPIASRRGLPMIEADDQKKLVKRREIAGFVERAGFRPVFVTTDTRIETESPPDSSTRPHVDS
jgi:hypothetical protein